jgi:hypothetical protein
VDINIKVIEKDEPNKAPGYVMSSFLILNLGEMMMRFFEEAKRWLGEIMEISLLLIALGIAVEILFGSSVAFFGGVVGNLTDMLTKLGNNGVVGLIALGIIVFLFRRRPVHQG